VGHESEESESVELKQRMFRASAPVRLDFAGGWTDVPPFATEERGVVVNGAIELRVHAELELGGERYLVRSNELGETAELREGVWIDDQAAGLELQRAALQHGDIGPFVLSTRSEVPPGSGLGGSGALGVALMAVLDAARDISRSPAALAEAAFQLEAFEAALPGGKQDQYAAALGGFHQLELTRDAVTVKPLDLDPEFLALLEQRIVLCYTGTSRVSSSMISRVMGSYTAGHPEVVNALRAMVDVADRLGKALLAGDLAETGRLLTANWRLQQQLDPGMCTPEMVRLETAMMAVGALGGKAAGAGAGGSMFFLAGSDVRSATYAAEQAGAQLLPFRWARLGVYVETVS
jgi:D-glycero-alpha-D-manno-heptose-7-phosphate kinase